MRTMEKTFGTRTKHSTTGADLAGMVGINPYYSDSLLQSFIFDKTLQLSEVPAVKPEVKPLSPSLFSYSFDVFHHDSSSIAVVNDCFADVVVCPSFETSFPSRNLFEKLLTGTSAFGLKLCPQTLKLNHFALDFLAAEELSLTCYSNVVYSDINTNLKSVRNLVDIDVSGKRDMQEHSIFVNGEKGGLWTPIKILPIAFWNFNRNINPPFDSCKPDFIKAKGECSLVKSQRHTFLKGGFRTFVSPDRFEGLGSNTISIYNKLRRQVKLLSSLVITEMMKLISVINTRIKSLVSDVRNNFRILFHSIKKQHIHRDFKLDGYNRLHTLLEGKQVFNLIGGEKGQFLPTLKCRVSLPQIL